MADNMQKYGFRWSTRFNGGPMPAPVRIPVATGQDFVVSAANYSLGAGDVVLMESTGMLDISLATEAVYGIVVGVEPYWDGSVMRPSNLLPSGVSYGTNLSRQSFLLVVPSHLGYWEVDCDDNTTATTLAAYQALVGDNADHAHSPNATTLRVHPRLDISDHKTGAAQWRIVNISGDVANKDFSGNYVKLIVAANETQWGPAYTSTGI